MSIISLLLFLGSASSLAMGRVLLLARGRGELGLLLGRGCRRAAPGLFGSARPGGLFVGGVLLLSLSGHLVDDILDGGRGHHGRHEQLTGIEEMAKTYRKTHRKERL